MYVATACVFKRFLHGAGFFGAGLGGGEGGEEEEGTHDGIMIAQRCNRAFGGS